MRKMTLFSLIAAAALVVSGCAEKAPEEEKEEKISYSNAYPAKLTLPEIRDEFGVFDLTWEEGDEPDLINADGKVVGRLELVSGEGNRSAVFQIWTDLTSGSVSVRFAGDAGRIAQGFVAVSESFEITGRMTTAELTIPVALVRARLSAEKGSKDFGAELTSVEFNGNGISAKATPAKATLLRFDSTDLLFAIEPADLSGKTVSCKVETYYDKNEVSVPGMNFQAGTISQIRLISTASGWKAPSSSSAPETYVYSSEIEDSKLYSVLAGGVNQKIYPSQDYHICSFGSKDSVVVEVRSTSEITSFAVRPLNKGYKATQLDSRTISFKIEPLGRAVVELNGSIDTPLFVFANALQSEYEADVAGIANLTRVRAGELITKNIYLKSGQALLIEGGAVVKGKAGASSATGAKIVGGGIVDSWEDFSEANGLKVQSCTDVLVKGITVICNTGRAFWTYDSSNLTYDNVKVLGTSALGSENRQTDAMDLYGARNANITHCFCFSNDDTYCIKTWKWGYKAETNYVSFEDCISWNYRGNGFEIGYETGLPVHDISYKNIYSVRSSCGRAVSAFRRGAVSIHGAAGGTISDITYDGVYIEDPWEGGIDMRILKSEYQIGTGETWSPGIITGVTMKNVKMEKMPVEGQTLYGYDSTHKISIEIENLEIAGTKISYPSQAKFHTNNYVDLTIK